MTKTNKTNTNTAKKENRFEITALALSDTPESGVLITEVMNELATAGNTVDENLKNITIKDFIDNLYYLEKQYITNGVAFSKKEILIFQKKIISNIYHPKIIKFQDFKNEKGRKK